MGGGGFTPGTTVEKTGLLKEKDAFKKMFYYIYGQGAVLCCFWVWFWGGFLLVGRERLDVWWAADTCTEDEVSVFWPQGYGDMVYGAALQTQRILEVKLRERSKTFVRTLWGFPVSAVCHYDTTRNSSVFCMFLHSVTPWFHNTRLHDNMTVCKLCYATQTENIWTDIYSLYIHNIYKHVVHLLNLPWGECKQQQRDGDVIFTSKIQHQVNTVHQFWLCMGTKHKWPKDRVHIFLPGQIKQAVWVFQYCIFFASSSVWTQYGITVHCG